MKPPPVVVDGTVKRPSLKSLAAKYGVSVATLRKMASRVNPATDTVRKLEAAAVKGRGVTLTAHEVRVLVQRITASRGIVGLHPTRLVSDDWGSL